MVLHQPPLIAPLMEQRTEKFVCCKEIKSELCLWMHALDANQQKPTSEAESFVPENNGERAADELTADNSELR